MVETAVMDIGLWSLRSTDWRSLNTKLPYFLQKLAAVTVPTIKWNPISAEFLRVTDHRGVLRINWQATGTPPLVIGILVISGILLAIFGAFLVITGIKTVTGESASEQRADTLQYLVDQRAAGNLTEAEFRAALGFAKEGGDPLSGTSKLVKTVAFAALVIIGGLIALSALKGRSV